MEIKLISVTPELATHYLIQKPIMPKHIIQYTPNPMIYFSIHL